MNKIIEAIKSRRSVRSFKSDALPRSELEAILDAAVWAPSGMNAQVWRFTALTRRAHIDRLNGLIRDSLRDSKIERFKAIAADPKSDLFYGAPVVVIASGEADGPTSAPDCALGLQNMMLAAASLGIGSCWVHAPARIASGPETTALRAELGIPESHAIFGSIALGYAAGPAPAAPPRKDGCTAILD